jgi:hypothetical protein
MYSFVFKTVIILTSYLLVHFFACESKSAFEWFGSYRNDHQPFLTSTNCTKTTIVVETEAEPHNFSGAGAID